MTSCVNFLWLRTNAEPLDQEIRKNNHRQASNYIPPHISRNVQSPFQNSIQLFYKKTCTLGKKVHTPFLHSFIHS